VQPELETTAIALTARLAAGALAALLVAAPAAAEQARAVLSVTAVVAPACAVAHEGGSRHTVACSTGASVSTMTARRHDEQPLDEAAAILGAPVRRGGDVVFTASVRTPAADAAATSGTGDARYLTITH